MRYEIKLGKSIGRRMIMTEADCRFPLAKTPLSEADAYIARNCYDAKRLKIERLSGDLLNMEQCYINLTIIKRSQETEAATKHPEAEYQHSIFSRSARLKVDRANKDEEIPLEALFDPRKTDGEEARRPSRILIRGRAGMGKTTLCKKIVHQFTHGKMWQRKFCRVLWIPLRNLKLKERCQVAGYNLRHLLSHEVFTESPKIDVLVDVLWRDLIATRNGNTLFILDGLDEVSSDLEGDMQRFLESLLNYPNVIITSRPHASLPPRVDPVDLEVETIGFYPEQVTEYISKTFSDMPNIGANVGSFLQNHQLMQDLVRIPVQLDALCYIWKDLGDQPIPQTMTAIYRRIEGNLWRKDGVKLGRFRSTQSVSQRALEAHMLNERHLLEALAFTGMHTNKVDFTQDHQEKVLDEVLETKISFLDDVLSQLSFLRTSNPSSRIEDRRYHFLHLTYQEYFAARYFVRQWIHGTQLFCYDWSKRTKRISAYDFIQMYKYETRYDIMWRFVAGLLNIQHGQEFHFFEIIEQGPNDLLGPAHQRLIMHCLSEVVPTADSFFLAIRSRLESVLTRWIMVECERTGRSLLAEESELSDQILENVFAQASDAIRIILLEAVGQRSKVPSCMIEFAHLWMSRSTHMHERRVAFQVLRKPSYLPEDIIHRVAAELEDSDRYIRRIAIEILGKQSVLADGIIRLVAARLENVDRHAREAAIEVLGNRSDLPEEILQSVVMRLEHPCEYIRQAAIEILGKRSDLSEHTLQSIAVRLDHPDDYVRQAPIEVLGRRPDLSEEVVQSVAARLKCPDPYIRQSAIEVLGRRLDLSEEIVQSVAARLED